MIPVLLSFLVGTVIGTLWIQSGVWLVAVCICLCLISGYRSRIICAMIVVLLGGYGLAVYQLVNYADSRQMLGDTVGWGAFDHTIEGRVGEMISQSEYSRKYRLSGVRIKYDSSESPILSDIALVIAPNLSLTTGDSVLADGSFSFPADTPEYAGEKNLWNRRMIAEFRSFHITKTPPDTYSFFVRAQQWFDARLDRLFPQEGHDLLSGILLGQRSDLSPDLRQALKSSGLMHLMVVSGGNVIMLIVFLSLFIRSVPIFLRIIIVAVTIGSFVLLVGGDAPVWRAALMGIIGYVGSLWGYRFPRMILPLSVGVLLALINPLSIVYDIGLQLSFLSVVCIIAFGRRLTEMFRWLGTFFAEALSMTIAATIGTFPITVYYFGTLSLIGPIANLFAAPAIPVLMYGGIVTLFVSTFSDTFAYISGFVPWIATTYLYRVIHLFGDPAWSMLTIDLGPYRVEFMVVSLLLLMILITRFSIKK